MVNKTVELFIKSIVLMFSISVINAETLYRHQGDTIVCSDTIQFEQTISSISFDVGIDNPTVLFVDSIRLNDVAMELQRDYKTIYCKLDNISISSPNLCMFATCLFGNDTAAELNIDNIMINNELTTLNISPIRVIISDNNLHLYNRFAKITKIYPLPCQIDDIFYIEYIIDNICDIDVVISDQSGKILIEYSAMQQLPGIYKLSSTIIASMNNININEIFARGVYHVKLISSTGNDTACFIIN